MLAIDPEADHVSDLRTSGETELQRAIRAAMLASGEQPETAERVVSDVERAKAEREARESSHRANRAQRRVLSRRDEIAPPAVLPQWAKPPMHTKYDHKREEEAERIAHGNALRAGIRQTVYLPAWSRAMARRCAIDRGAATRELGYVPRTVADSIRSSAAPFGGLDSAAGRNVVALGVVFYWLASRLRGRLSGLSSNAWASLTVGAHGKHYSSSALFHAHHRHEEAELDPHARGIYGGRIGIGRNLGLVRALEVEGWLRVIVPDAQSAPGWMVGPSGWAFVQLIVSELEPGEDSS